MSEATYRFSIDLTNPAVGDLQLIENMGVRDKFFDNHNFPIDCEHFSVPQDLRSKNRELIGVVGRQAFHIFDKTNLTWISHTEMLGSVTLG